MEREKQIEEICELICKTNGHIHSSDYFLVDAEAIYKAGYRKVEQGKWVDVKKSYSTSLGEKGTSPYRMCTACKWEYPVITVGQHLKKYKYCPNCGAYMKGE